MTDEELNRAVAAARGHKVEMCDDVWSEEDWLCSEYPTARNVYGIIPANRTFGPGSLSSSPALPIPDVCGAAWGALFEELANKGHEPSITHDRAYGYRASLYESAASIVLVSSDYEPAPGRALALAFLASKGISV